LSKSISVRLAKSSDERRLSPWLILQSNSYIRFSPKALGHWLSTQSVFVAEDRSGFVGFLLCLPTYGEFAAIIGLVVANLWDVEEVIAALLEGGMPLLRRRGIAALNCVTGADWLAGALVNLDFQFSTRLASYLKDDADIPVHGNTQVTVRDLSEKDVPGVLDVDAAAFAPMWRQDEDLLLSYLQPRTYLIGAEWQRTLIGYASGAWNGDRGHINRLAVHPQTQGRGVGSRLLAESLIRFRKRDVRHVTLNTQADNEASRRLYERFGFHLVDLCTQAFTRRLPL